MMLERDNVIDLLPKSERTQMFVVVPIPMMEWV
jgi:hypothetical protein